VILSGMITFILILFGLWMISSHMEEKETKALMDTVLNEIKLAHTTASAKEAEKAKCLALVSWHEEVIEEIKESSRGVLVDEWLDSSPEAFIEEFELGLSPETTVAQLNRDMYGPSEDEKAVWTFFRSSRQIYLTPRKR
jgi:hypothetical protein